MQSDMVENHKWQGGDGELQRKFSHTAVEFDSHREARGAQCETHAEGRSTKTAEKRAARTYRTERADAIQKCGTLTY